MKIKQTSLLAALVLSIIWNAAAQSTPTNQSPRCYISYNGEYVKVVKFKTNSIVVITEKKGSLCETYAKNHSVCTQAFDRFEKGIQPSFISEYKKASNNKYYHITGNDMMVVTISFSDGYNTMQITETYDDDDWDTESFVSTYKLTNIDTLCTDDARRKAEKGISDAANRIANKLNRQ